VAVAETIVILRALGLGDFCTGVPALKALRRAFSTHRLLLAAPAWQTGLAKGLVDDVVATDGLTTLSPALHDAVLAVNLHGRGPQSTRALLAAAPRRLCAFRHPAVDATGGSPAWRDGEHDRRRWCRLLAERLEIATHPDDLRLDVPDVAAPVRPGAVIVHPGASAAARRWPARSFAAVARAVADAGYEVAVTGTPAEAPLCRAVVEGSGRRVDVFAGTTTVEQLAATVACAAAVITNDTGVAHLASAYGTPSVVLFGPVPPAAWGPPRKPWHRALWKGRSGDAGDPHGVNLDPRLAAIDVEDVLAAFADIVTASAGRPAVVAQDAVRFAAEDPDVDSS
jgi:ADP-heptose:LPS heptosyltransferase